MAENTQDLWCGMDIPVIGLTGEKWSGKSVWASSIDPENTLMIDLELSTASYKIAYKKRLSLYQEVLKRTNGKQPTPLDCYLWFYDLIVGIQPGEYSTVAIDPISDIEAGLTMWIEQNPEEFGHTKAQYERMSGTKWGDLSAKWKLILGVLASKIKTFVFTAHLGSVWGSDGRPMPGQTKPKGKSVLMELASLYLQLERKPNQQGVIPAKPTARVLKSRLLVNEFVDGEMKIWPVLPGSVPECDPKKIRWYIQNPVGKRDITEGEKALQPSAISDDEKLLLKAQIVGEQLEIEKLKTGRLESFSAAARAVQARAAAAQSQPVSSAASAATGASSIPATEASAVTTPAASSVIENAKKLAANRTKKAETAKTEKVTEKPVEKVAEPAATSSTAPTPVQSTEPVTQSAPSGTAEKPFNPAPEQPTVYQVINAQFTALASYDPKRWTPENISVTLKTGFGAENVMALTPENANKVSGILANKLIAAGLPGDGSSAKN